jgi:hypothetical protein
MLAVFVNVAESFVKQIMFLEPDLLPSRDAKTLMGGIKFTTKTESGCS